MSEREHCPGPWVIPAGNDNGTVICEGDDPEKPGRILFVLREAWGTREAANYEQLAAYGRRLVHAVNNHADMLAALRNVNRLVSEAAMTGFNCRDGDWAERLFASQHVTHSAIRQAEGRPLTSTMGTKS